MANPNLTLKNPAKGSMDWDATMSENFNAIVAYAKANNTTVADALAALDNKVEGNLKIYVMHPSVPSSLLFGIKTTDTIDELITKIPDNTILHITMYQNYIVEGWIPSGELAPNATVTANMVGLLTITRISSARILFEYSRAANASRSWERYIGSYQTGLNPPSFSGWKLLGVDNTPWYNLPLAEGIEPAGIPKYKRHNGFVVITGTFKMATPPTPAQLIATLPVGFRSPVSVNFALVQGAGVNNITSASYAWLLPNGTIQWHDGPVSSSFNPSSPVGLNVTFPVA